jgi:arylsulfatase A-like enzyme
MTPSLNRRDFLKLATLLPLASLRLSPYIEQLDASVAASVQADPDQPNVLIVVLDSLSARNMSLFGYPRNTTPNINQFANNATVFHKHYSGGNFTTPGTASLLTGALPWSHHALNIQGMVNNLFVPRNIFNLSPFGTNTLSYSQNLLAITLLYQFKDYLTELEMPRELALEDLEYSDLLFNNDYNISFISENSILRGDKRVTGSLFSGFLYRGLSRSQKKELNAEYKKQFPRGVPNQDNVYFLLEDSIDWILEQTRTQLKPFLAYYHLLPPHSPYTPRKDYMAIFDNQYVPLEKPQSFASSGIEQTDLNKERLLYDRFIANVDAEFGRLISGLQQAGLLGNTYVILTSDHGELFERGIWGHITPVLYEPIVHIPLIIYQPGGRPHHDVYEYTSSIDLLPTLRNIYGLPIPDWCEGQVLPLSEKSPAIGERGIYAMDSKESSRHAPITDGTFMVIREDYKLVHYMGSIETPTDELYNLANDPEEMDNLIEIESSRADDLRQQLTYKLAEVNKGLY